jgi:hypothetical protein
MRFQRLALIGCGLMGGSFALAVRQASLVHHIAGFSASEKTRQRALELGVIDEAVAQAFLFKLARFDHTTGTDNVEWFRADDGVPPAQISLGAVPRAASAPAARHPRAP